MRILATALLITVLASAAAAQPTDLLFSEYAEGSSNNKALELYNGTGRAVDLSTYVIEIYFNGQTSPGQTIRLSGTLADGDVYVIANSSIDTGLLSASLIDRFNGGILFNGNDAVVLRSSGDVVDAIGQVGTTASYAPNVTLRRLAAACTGDTTPTDAFDPAADYEAFGRDTFDGFGSHTASCIGGGTSPSVQFSETSATVDEDTGSILQTIVLSDPDGTAVTVDVSLTGGTATSDDLAGFTGDQVTFPATVLDGDTQTITVPIEDDNENEGLEEQAEFTLRVVSGSAAVGASLFTLTILDNDAPAISECTAASYTAQAICGGLSGPSLIACLQQTYTPDPANMPADYARAREYLYARIDNDGGTLTGVYTGYQITGVPTDLSTVRPVVTAGDMNTEHTWPQSLGIRDDEPGARTNLHHLFPTNVNVNADRQNYPFAELDDDQETDVWYKLTVSQTTKPGEDIDDWSELGSDEQAFEPREAHKGNAARALLYMKVIYAHLVSSADAEAFFDGQVETLVAWNALDEVDQQEYERTCAIAAIQDGKVNPFVIDTTLAARAFSPDPPIPVELVSFTGLADDPVVRLAWETASETNNAGFEVQRAADGLTFETLGFVEGAGTTATPQTYRYVDPAAVGGTLTYRLRQVDYDGTSTLTEAVTVTVRPQTFTLEKNYPNPFNPQTTIRYALPEAAEVRLTVFDALGRRVRDLVQAPQEAGYHEVRFDAAGLPSGLYGYRLVAGGKTAFRTMLLAK